MKKYLIIILVVMVAAILAIRTPKVSAVQQFNSDQRVKTAVMIGGPRTIFTAISGNNRLLGYKFSDSSSASQIRIYDASDYTGTTAANRIIVDGVSSGASTGDFLPYPRDLDRGISVECITNTGALTVYYE